MRFINWIIGFVAIPVLTNCAGTGANTLNSFVSPPPMRWDHHPQAKEWTVNTLMAVAEEDDALAKRIPADIESWCPGYKQANLLERRAFWTGLISAVGKYESSYNPRAAGGGGKYIGIMQISPRSAANYGCNAKSSASLKNGSANLQCAVEMVAYHVKRDGVAVGNGSKGIGRDWMPFRASGKRAEMARWLSKQSYCKG